MLVPERGLGLDPRPRAAEPGGASSAAGKTFVHGCPIAIRCVAGPAAREIYLHCQPPADALDAASQAAAVYRAILVLLDAEGGSYEHVVAETIFLRDLRAGQARGLALAAWDATGHRPATLEIEQPPLDERACLEVSVQAIVPGESPLRASPVVTMPDGDGGARGLLVEIGPERRFYAAGLCAAGSDAYQQTLGMFGLAEELLQKAGMEFRDVVRTWIHLRHMDRDYSALNRARREFFAAREIAPPPASTGIGGGPVSPEHDLCLSVYAVLTPGGPARTVMTTPTLNEASEYGADFVRGLRVTEANKVALYASGTASIDERGQTVHVGDVDAQAERMLLNIATLLERQGARYSDVVHAITYVKHVGDAGRIRRKLREAGFEGFPQAMVVAPICRPGLLCETEALAALPVTSRPGTSPVPTACPGDPSSPRSRAAQASP
jgi:enamine deaminase RidA (YjgF/YER057c/UK114 family)